MPHTAARPPDKEIIPRTLARAMLALVLSCLALVTLARLTDRALIAVPPQGVVAAERHLLLSGAISGAATVRAADGRLIAELSPEEGGFVAGVWRVIARERIKHRAAPDGPVTLVRHESGRISIRDPATGWSADLMGFGADNARAFARLLAQ